MTPLFAELALVRRVEAAEAELVAAASRVAGGVALPLGSGRAIFTGPGSPSNKCIGMGLDPGGDLLSDGELLAAEAAFADGGEGLRLELCSLARPEVQAQLGGRGYRLVGFENVLGRRLEGAAEALEAGRSRWLEARPVTELDPWKGLLIEGFAHPDGSPVGGESFSREVLEEALRHFTRVEGLQRYLACAGDRPVGAASMRVHDRIALLCGASTLPDVRRRGVQTLLLRRRLDDAREQGCELAVITTAPGSRSQANAMRHGFQLLYLRAVLTRPLAPAPSPRE